MERETEKFRVATHEKLAKAAARKSRALNRQAEADRAALHSKYGGDGAVGRRVA